MLQTRTSQAMTKFSELDMKLALQNMRQFAAKSTWAKEEPKRAMSSGRPCLTLLVNEVNVRTLDNGKKWGNISGVIINVTGGASDERVAAALTRKKHVELQESLGNAIADGDAKLQAEIKAELAKFEECTKIVNGNQTQTGSIFKNRNVVRLMCQDQENLEANCAHWLRLDAGRTETESWNLRQLSELPKSIDYAVGQSGKWSVHEDELARLSSLAGKAGSIVRISLSGMRYATNTNVTLKQDEAPRIDVSFKVQQFDVIEEVDNCDMFGTLIANPSTLGWTWPSPAEMSAETGITRDTLPPYGTGRDGRNETVKGGNLLMGLNLDGGRCSMPQTQFGMTAVPSGDFLLKSKKGGMILSGRFSVISWEGEEQFAMMVNNTFMQNLGVFKRFKVKIIMFSRDCEFAGISDASGWEMYGPKILGRVPMFMPLEVDMFETLMSPQNDPNDRDYTGQTAFYSAQAKAPICDMAAEYHKGTVGLPVSLSYVLVECSANRLPSAGETKNQLGGGGQKQIMCVSEWDSHSLKDFLNSADAENYCYYAIPSGDLANSVYGDFAKIAQWALTLPAEELSLPANAQEKRRFLGEVLLSPNWEGDMRAEMLERTNPFNFVGDDHPALKNNMSSIFSDKLEVYIMAVLRPSVAALSKQPVVNADNKRLRDVSSQQDDTQDEKRSDAGEAQQVEDLSSATDVQAPDESYGFDDNGDNDDASEDLF